MHFFAFNELGIGEIPFLIVQIMIEAEPPKTTNVSKAKKGVKSGMVSTVVFKATKCHNKVFTTYNFYSSPYGKRRRRRSAAA
jgi:hypothetical protein